MSMTRPQNGQRHIPQAACLALLVLGCGLSGCDQKPVVPAPPVPASRPPDTIQLFSGLDLTGWEKCRFGGDGDVSAMAGELELTTGRPLTGVVWKGGELPATNYRLSLEAQRVSGIDLFCCLTFPVGDSHCSLVVGGWAGTVVGLSCVDGSDARDNQSSTLMAFNNGQWYRIDIEVNDQAIIAAIDGQELVRQPRAGHVFSVRTDVRRTVPLGVVTYESTSRIRDFRLERLPAAKGNSP